MIRRTIGTIVLSFTAGLAGAYFYTEYFGERNAVHQDQESTSPYFQMASSTSPNSAAIPAELDFVEASRESTRSVVYIKNISEQMTARSYLDYFFDRNSGVETRISSGSGVILSTDGYIVTNNHVVQEADQIEVVYNKRNYTARLIGVDPSTDLAVLKIDEENLPAIRLGSSRTVDVGEWVIAVGNPFNLTSTVTAGIVSAKGREINILQSSFPIESFIQTDAAINPGNSGGALVNVHGELVGINTAILSRTGSYAGYGFAVPVDIMKKVVDDLIEYGEVQKAFFGGDVYDFDSDIAERLDIQISNNQFEGVLLGYIQQEGAAAKSGMKEGDIILRIDNLAVNSRAEFEEIMSYHSPGDRISVVYQRNGKQQEASITLTNREGTTSILHREIFSSDVLGASLETVSKVERDIYKIDHGVKVYDIGNGLLSRLGFREEFIITDINDYPVRTPEELIKILTNIHGRVKISGVNKDGQKGFYAFNFR